MKGGDRVIGISQSGLHTGKTGTILHYDIRSPGGYKLCRVLFDDGAEGWAHKNNLEPFNG